MVGLVWPPAFKFLFKEKTSRKRVGLVFGGALFGILIIISAIIPPSEKPSELSSTASSTQVVSGGSTTTQLVTTTPEKEPSEEDRLRALVQEIFKGTNNLKQEQLRKVDVVKQSAGWVVSVEFNADENLTKNLTKKSMETDMAKAYRALYTSGIDVKQTSITAYFPLQDEYGNNKDAVVYKTSLARDVADKINWQAEKVTLEARIIPGLWETVLLHEWLR